MPAATLDETSTTFILVTGANSGLGFSICCRLIDEFLQTRPPTQTLTLIPTTRSKSKADDTVIRLARHVDRYCRSNPRTRDVDQERIAIEPELLDLCNLVSIKCCCDGMRKKYKRLDVVILNAGIGGWMGVNWIGCFKQFFREGMGFVLRPDYKIGSLGRVVKRQGLGNEEEPPLGEVFCANVFGHYLLVHYLTDLLCRRVGDDGGAARVIWVSTLEAHARTFSLDDFQGIANPLAYESSKRLTDVLALTVEARATEIYTQEYFSTASSALSKSDKKITSEAEPPAMDTRPSQSSARLSTTSTISISQNATSASQSQSQRPKFYLTHPGVCVTAIIQIPPIMVFFQVIALYVARFLGSPWQNIDSYSGATSMVWLALADEKTLRDMDATRGKWGSAVNRMGSERVKRTPVDGFAEEDGSLKKKGTAEFEEVGRKCWKGMEELRLEWQRRLHTKEHEGGDER